MPTPIRGDAHSEHADSAAHAAAVGALIGAVKWGAISAVGGMGAYYFSPLFRGLTVQFRVYLWMCPTTIGSMLEADHRLRRYEAVVRAGRRKQIEAAREKEYADELAELEAIERKNKKGTTSS